MMILFVVESSLLLVSAVAVVVVTVVVTPGYDVLTKVLRVEENVEDVRAVLLAEDPATEKSTLIAPTPRLLLIVLE